MQREQGGSSKRSGGSQKKWDGPEGLRDSDGGEERVQKEGRGSKHKASEARQRGIKHSI